MQLAVTYDNCSVIHFGSGEKAGRGRGLNHVWLRGACVHRGWGGGCRPGNVSYGKTELSVISVCMYECLRAEVVLWATADGWCCCFRGRATTDPRFVLSVCVFHRPATGQTNCQSCSRYIATYHSTLPKNVLMIY